MTTTMIKRSIYKEFFLNDKSGRKIYVRCPFRVHSDIMESCRGKIAISYGNFSKVYLVWKKHSDWVRSKSCLLDENKGPNKVRCLNIWRILSKNWILNPTVYEHQTENRNLKKLTSKRAKNIKFLSGSFFQRGIYLSSTTLIPFCWTNRAMYVQASEKI